MTHEKSLVVDGQGGLGSPRGRAQAILHRNARVAEMAERKRKCVGRVRVKSYCSVELERATYHGLHRVFVRRAIPSHGKFDLRRWILEKRDSSLGGGQQRSRARFAQAQCRLHVDGHITSLKAHRPRLVVREQFAKTHENPI